jgi:hypothetical protein
MTIKGIGSNKVGLMMLPIPSHPAWIYQETAKQLRKKPTESKVLPLADKKPLGEFKLLPMEVLSGNQQYWNLLLLPMLGPLGFMIGPFLKRGNIF